MELRPLHADDRSDVGHYLAIVNACNEVDSPWDHELTWDEAVGQLVHGWDGDLGERFLAVVDGEVVGDARYFTSPWDNPHLAWTNLRVHPAHRHRGHGSAIVEQLVARARDEGRRTVGCDGWESPGVVAFGERHGFSVASRGVVRRQFLAATDWAVIEALHKEAAGHAAAYELERVVGPSPGPLLAEVAGITGAINDAPIDDLDWEDEVFPPERVARYENAQAARGHLIHRLLARHRETGELAGLTVVVVVDAQPTIGEQHDTSVVRAHRGHRLGLYLKTAMLLWLREAQPQLLTIDTGNAESNDHMIAINEQLGYRVMAVELELQKRLHD